MFTTLASTTTTTTAALLPKRLKRWTRPSCRTSSSASGSSSEDELTRPANLTPRERRPIEPTSPLVTSPTEFIPSTFSRSSPMSRSTRPKLSRADTPTPLSPRSSQAIGVNLRVGGWIGVPSSSLITSP
ncbi:hypothetical protein [Phaffia rhodozyma]|uniref:Uncharacterized protein n=1 Tax=Phaffia rhodozyma TaxID=264483 RepID=A0A0F7SQ81_PHARH|nr:hypothetical protein [Phaffia rhodozyma]